MEFATTNANLDPGSFHPSEIDVPHMSGNGYDLIFRNVVFDYQESLGKIT